MYAPPPPPPRSRLSVRGGLCSGSAPAASPFFFFFCAQGRFLIIANYCKFCKLLQIIANLYKYCTLLQIETPLCTVITHDVAFLQIIENYCKLKLDFALRLLSLQIIAYIADIANYCKLLQIIVHYCTLTLTFALRLLSLHTASLVFSQTARCVPLLVKSRDFVMMDILY